MIDILTVDVEVAFISGQPRNIMVLNDYFYFDRKTGITWDIPKRFVSDGASIPQIVWTFLGVSPFIHPGRMAFLPHDVACVAKGMPYQEVHLMYYHCLMDLGAPYDQAKQFYKAVVDYGPQWNIKGEDMRALSDKLFEESVGEDW